MSATEDDTELRDILIQNLENNGILNKLKAEMRAAVFLAMDEQDRVENKTPLVNENLKKCLNTKDGRLIASLIIDFLQVFNLDFTLAVFQPEINSLNGLDSRDHVCRELGITETDLNRNTPLLLELTRRGRHKDKASIITEGDKTSNTPKELSLRQIADARKKFDIRDKDRTGVKKEDLKSIFTDLFPNFNKNMLERHIADELRTADKALNKAIDFQEFLGLYRRLFIQCRSVVAYDCGDAVHPPTRFDEKMSSSLASKIPRFKGHKHSGKKKNAPKGSEASRADPGLNSGALGKGDIQLASRHSEAPGGKGHSSSVSLKKALDLEVEEDVDEGDSFFDDPLPRPQKTYGCSIRSLREESLSGRSLSLMRRGASLNDLSALGSDTEGEELLSDNDHKLSSEHRRAESAKPRGSPVGSLSDAAPPKSKGSNASGDHSHREHSGSRNGTSYSKDKGVKDLKPNDRTASLVLDDDVEYDDDFNSHRSDISKSEVSIGEEIEEVSIEGPENSDKLDESTQDLSVSQLNQSQGVDYMEDVA